MKNLFMKKAMWNDSRTTVERQSSDGHPQRHYSLTPPSKRWMGLVFTFILLFTLSIGQMWATATNFHTFKAAGDTIIDIETTGGTTDLSDKMSAVNSTDWAAVNTGNKNSSIYRMDPSTEEVAESKINVYGTKLGSSAKSTYKVTGVSNVIFYVGTGTADRIAKLDVTENGKSKVSEAASVTLSNKNNAYKMSYALDASKSYTLEAYASGDIFCYAVKFTVASKCTKPGTPTALAAGSVTHNSASLSWTAGANNDGHKIYIEKKSDKTKVLDWTDATSPYAASGLDPETTYTFKVKAKGATGYCDLGDEASADFATDVDPLATTYKITLVPAGGTISDATGWTLNAGNYEKEVSDGTELALPTFTKTNRTFKTWRKAGPTDVTSPITVTADVTLTAVWNATIENVLYSWESPDGTAVEVGGTAVTKDQDGNNVEGNTNVNAALTNVTVAYKSIMLNGKISSSAWSGNYIQITTDEAVKTGDKVKVTACTTKGDTSKKGSAQMRAGTSATSTAIFTDGNSYNDISADGTLSPNTKTFTVPDGVNTSTLTMTRSQSSTNCWVTKLQIIRETQVEEGDLLTVTFNTNGGSSISPVMVASGQTVAKPADPTKAHNRFNEWKLSGSTYNFSTPVTSNITLDANWTQLYTISFAAGEGSGDAPSAIEDKAKDETFTVPANTFTAPSSKEFDKWNDGSADYAPGATYTVGTANVTLTAIWKAASTKYEITKGTHPNGDFTISVEEQEEGGSVTLVATPDEDYVFSAWDVYKTDESSTKVTVTSNTFTMPAYAVTVDATFAADPRAKVLYVTSNTADATKANDKLYDALKDIYNVKIVGPTSDADQSGYALVVLHESVGGGDYNKTAVATAKTGSTPVLNTKSYFYNDGRFGWGAPNAGTSVKGATLNSAYCNIADHPLFSGVTVTDGFVEITDDAAAKCMQPVGSFSSGYEGYTLATTPNAESGNGCAIHEIPAGTAARGVSSGKYLMISVSSAKLDALNANGKKLFQNAAAYLIDGLASWTPIAVPTSATVTASPSAAYSKGDNISLTASATGVSATTTYTWYKGTTLEAAKEAGAIKAAATAAAGGNTYTKNDCVLGDAGIYWCVISNGTGCEASASVEITVVDASYTISFTSAHGTAPSATTGVSYTLPELTASGWEHQGWTASVNVFVDLEEVTAGTLIANGKVAVFGANVTFTAVWAEVFDVIFNGNGHGTPIAPQVVVDGELATDPGDPSEIGWIFGGWFTNAACTAGNEWDFASDVVTEDTELFAKWTAFDGCVELWPATSGSAPAAVGDAIVMQTGSKGAAMTVAAKPDRLTYTAYGLQFGNESGVKVNVVLNNDMTVGTKISLTLVATNTGARGLHLYNAAGSAKITSLGWADATVGAEETFTYTVVADDGLDGTNGFQLWRNNTVCLKSLKVESCGDAIIYHNLTYAVDPAAKGTVTLGASSVREGLTTTATYSEIASGYEFDEWQISGTGASIADASANPAVITMGTADAVVTLKLKVETPSHTVSFNKMGKGDDIAPQNVKEGAKVTEPSVTEPEGWILEGWYKEVGLENKWNFASDVMSTSNITLYAKWIADTSIKLFSNTGELNTTNFVSAAKKDGGIDINAVNYPCLEQFAANRSSLGGTVPADMVQYNATTNAAKIKITFYNTNSSAKRAYLYRVKEGDTEATPLEISVPGQEIWTTEYYTFNGEENRSFYITAGDRSNIRILQVRVVDDGTPIKQAGQAGYSLNFNKGRMYVKNGTATTFEGMTMNTSSEYKVFNNSNIATTSNFSFTTTVDKMVLKVTRAGGNYYVSQDPASKGTIYNKTQEIVLTPAGTWYIGSETSGSAASFSKIEFIAPRCAEPAFNALANSDICSGDPYVALNGTATVADGGTPTYQWYRENNTAIEGETNATYTPSADGKYYVIAVNHKAGFSDNEKKSDLVTVTTHTGTAISEELADQRGNVGDVVALAIVATGKNVHYAWKESATIDGTYTDVAGAADAASLNVTITEGMDKYYKVVVSSDCGADQESVAHVTQYVPVAQANVTGSIAWNWANAASVNEIKLTSSTSPKKNEGFVMANGAASIYNNVNFESDKLYLECEYIVRDSKYFQGQTIKFNTTVPGAVRVKFSHTGNATEDKPARELYINGVATGEIRDNATAAWSGYIEVPAGEVSITAYYVDPVAKPGQQYIRVPEIEFLALADRRTGSWIAPGELGTVCLKDDAKVDGATIYELSGCDANGYMAFDVVESGELEAGKPYLFEATRSGNVSFYKTVGANHTETAATENTKGMYGTFDPVTFTADDENIYYFSGRHIWAVKDFTVSITIPAYRCYVDYAELRNNPAEAPAPGRRRVVLGVNGKNTPTGMDNVQGDKEQSTKVLINGHLYILRGEKMFDATGRLVK